MNCANCKWVQSTHESALFGHLTCGNFLSVEARNSRESAPSLTVVPDRCVEPRKRWSDRKQKFVMVPGCGEPLTPKTTKGAYLCKCDQPKPPRSVLEAAERAPVPTHFRYGN